MTRYFMRDTPLCQLEQQMMTPPNFKARGHGRYSPGFQYSSEDTECPYCINFRRNQPCPLKLCICLDERIAAGALNLNEFVRDCFFPEAGVQLLARLERNFTCCSISFFLNECHRERWQHWRERYCRTSKPKQSIERQIRNIKAAYPDAVIVQEVFTRTRLDRPEWLKLMRRIQPGDEIVFDSVSRMSGDAKERFAAYEELYQKGVNLVYLKEPHINTETYKKALENNVQLTGSNVDYILEGVNRYLLELAKEQIRLAFEQSEKEVQDLHQRTREGIETARLNGKQIGRQKNSVVVTRKSIESKEVVRKLSKEFGGNLSDAEIMRLTGLARNTYYKYKRELKGEHGT